MLIISQVGEVPKDISHPTTHAHTKKKRKKTVSWATGAGSQSRYLEQHLYPGTEPWASHKADKLYENTINMKFWRVVARAGGQGWEKRGIER